MKEKKEKRIERKCSIHWQISLTTSRAIWPENMAASHGEWPSNTITQGNGDWITGTKKSKSLFHNESGDRIFPHPAMSCYLASESSRVRKAPGGCEVPHSWLDLSLPSHSYDNQPLLLDIYLLLIRWSARLTLPGYISDRLLLGYGLESM